MTSLQSTLYASDTIPLMPTGTDVTDTSGEGPQLLKGGRKMLMKLKSVRRHPSENARSLNLM